MKFTPTPQQESIFTEFINSKDHVNVEALAGCGKTSTSVEALTRLRQHRSTSRPTFVAFNVSIANELKKRLPRSCRAGTFHSFGRRALLNNGSNLTFDESGDYLKTYLKHKSSCPAKARAGVLRLVSQLKNDAVLPDQASELDVSRLEAAGRLDLTVARQVAPISLMVSLANELLAFSTESALFGYDDMLYRPYVTNTPIFSSRTIVCDESQDLNPVQHHHLHFAARSGKRIIAVGDEHQAIYQFRGAAEDSINLLFSDLPSHSKLPLTVTFRCPQSVTATARKYVSHFECPSTFPDGTVREGYIGEASIGDMVLCRYNRPLVSQCISFWRRGTPAFINGRELSTRLLFIVDELANSTQDGMTRDCQNLLEKCHLEIESSDEPNQRKKELAHRIDFLQCLLTLIDSCKDKPDLVSSIRRLTTDHDRTKAIMLSTVHKAKGLENPNVFLLESEKLLAQQSGPERNIAYVAVTRSSNNLILC